jgi:hypothetical protein
MDGYDELFEEHRDHEAGAFANESQAAFALSQRTQEYPRDGAKVAAIVAAGRFAVVLHYLVYCVHTDATLATATTLVSDHATREEANAALAAFPLEEGDEHWYVIEPKPAPQPLPVAAVEDYNDLPF